MSGTIEVDDLTVEWQINKRRKRNVGFLFQPDGRLVLDAPPRTKPSELEEMVREHIRWVRHRMRRAKADAPEHPPLSIADGALIPFQGRTMHVLWQQARRKRVHALGDTLHVSAPRQEDVREVVRGWYREQAVPVFDRLIDGWSHLPFLANKRYVWRQRYMKSQWGSCSIEGNITLNTHLMKLPERLADYVILHELCHLKYMDHGRGFHGLMHRHMPDWETRRRAINKYINVLLGD